MSQRFNPYDSPSQQQRQQALNSQMQEALYMQRQRELQRDIQIRQMLLQEQLDHQQLLATPLTSSLQQQALQRQQRLYELQQYRQAGQSTMATLREEQMLINKQREDQLLLNQQEQLRRFQFQQQQQQQQQRNLQMGMAAAMGAEGVANDNFTRLAPGAARKPAGVEDLEAFKAQVRRNDPISREEFVKRERGTSHDSTDGIQTGSPNLKPKAAKTTAAKKAPAPLTSEQASLMRDPDAREALEALVGKDLKNESSLLGIMTEAASPEPLFTLGTVDDLLTAADGVKEKEEAAHIMEDLKDVNWSDTESEASFESAQNPNAISIEIPGFKSTVPSLMEEPEFQVDKLEAEKKSKEENGKSTAEQNGDLHLSSSERKASPQGLKTKGGGQASTVDYPYPVDTWWPSITTIRRERRMHGEKSDEEDFIESSVLGEESPFRADMATIRARLSNDVEPGVLEKVPHCKIHRQRMRHQKAANTPDHAFCWQVTESYCNDVMVCCSICSTWRHASCGGHYKPFSVRDTIMSETPFTPICDQCHEEQKILESFAAGSARLDRQRTELLRRAMQTSAVIRQACFAKHSGTYKWPLGSVSATHIGGHTRSVHSRHDKAEKQWAEMAQKLGRGFGYRTKERTKVRTRELERLLVSVEDAETSTDRHNMVQFLDHDIKREHPAGFDKRRLNLFDPEDDSESVLESGKVESTRTDLDEDRGAHIGRRVRPRLAAESSESKQLSTCARENCAQKSRFDSMFCSDACGIAALEADLLRSLYFAEDIHPSLLRS